MNWKLADRTPLLGMKRKPAVRRRQSGMKQSRCSHCNEAVQFKTYKALSSFLNSGRVCDACVARNVAARELAEDTFRRIDGSNAAQDAFARR